jgi:hypothetical protein
MRIGSNPAKGTKIEYDDAYHRIVIPVYIPNLEGFFKESLKVLQLTLQSLYSTIHNKTKISIVSNGSCREVNSFLNEELELKKIDELFLIKAGIGKINSIFSIVNNVKEPLVTLTDADVLFTSGWQKDVEQVFIDYPKVGMVCPFSFNKGFRELTANIYFDNLFNRNIKISKVKDPKPLEHFAKSVGNEKLFKEIHKKHGIVYQKKTKSKVFIGAGHFVATFKTAVFDHYKFQGNLRKMSNGEREFIDTPPLNYGLWRVSTFKNYVYHMGNTLTPFYTDILEKNVNDESIEFSSNNKLKKVSKQSFFIKNKLFSRIIFSNKVFVFYLRRKGFTNKEANDYLNIFK